MEYVRLGRTGLKVSRVCQGSNMIGGYVNEAAGIPLLNACLDEGINFIDTANVYAGGKSEEIIGKALKNRRYEAVIMSKVGGPMGGGKGPNDRGSSRKYIMQALEVSLKRLQTDYVDVFMMHYWDPVAPLEETMSTLDEIVKQGKARYLGCSNFVAWQLCKALWISDKHGLERFEAIQPQYNFVDRNIEAEMLPLCLDQGISITPYWVLMGGMFTGKYKAGEAPPPDSRFASRPGMSDRYFKDQNFRIVKGIEEIAAKSGRTSTEVVLGWALGTPGITSVIVGGSKIEQVKQNAKYGDIKLTPEEMAACNKLN